jgi:hypothetical protein
MAVDFGLSGRSQKSASPDAIYTFYDRKDGFDLIGKEGTNCTKMTIGVKREKKTEKTLGPGDYSPNFKLRERCNHVRAFN